MKRKDLKAGTIFRYINGPTSYKISHSKHTGLQVWSYEDEACKGPSNFEGHVMKTDSNKGFTLYRFVMRNQVITFFPFNQFEVINQ